MRKINVISMITLDGVLQGPGGPEEDTSNQFEYGGWAAPHGGEESEEIMAKLMQPSDYLLGRKTFDIWEDYWPLHAEVWPGINDGMKYIFSNTKDSTDWKNTKFLKNLSDIRKLKQSEGSDLQVWGSGELIQLLLKHDLVDELWVIIFPLTLGQGKKLFSDGVIPAAFTLKEGTVTPSGLIIANYKREGDIETGIAGA
ncbi:dihydrofolate reductase family protein [Gracilimonas tropica]|uniref:dihydrofolate reductase family protein n=1 Tax=Gracilimonas tropica TaxID=454600 RepID=UPI00036528E1|nr:dihydrofolate reductase family protein [Gracilimonas tropica]